MNPHILGIRHHGVGSAKHIAKMLDLLKPDIILIEGPPEITDILSYADDINLVPPVAIMIYNQDIPKQSVFYPYSKFSPEWIAIKYGLKNQIPIRPIDMPATLKLFEKHQTESINTTFSEKQTEIVKDPLQLFADISGFETVDDWWDNLFENGFIDSNTEDHFKAIELAMVTIRNNQTNESEENLIRETFMRQQIRNVLQEMYSQVVVICGAYHIPALLSLDKFENDDIILLKKYSKLKTKIRCSWIPWTNSRLAINSGYGAGIQFPGWYQHLFENEKDYDLIWLIKVAGLLREKGKDISPAHIIETTRLATALASLRNKSNVSLSELNEAILAIMCMGDRIVFEYIRQDLLIGQEMGKVSDKSPKMPLHEDFDRQIKLLRLPLESYEKILTLDLRKENDLSRSIFLHRINLINLKYASIRSQRSKGTFKEVWTLYWDPSLIIDLNEFAHLGNTVDDAATNFISEKVKNEKSIFELSKLISIVLPAELFKCIDPILMQINDLSAISSDIIDVINAVPQLINLGRYGDVRKTDLTIIKSIAHNLLEKIIINLPAKCYGLDDEQSDLMYKLIFKLNASIQLNQDMIIIEDWHTCLHKIKSKDNIHPQILGATCRLIIDLKIVDYPNALQIINFSLSTNQTANYVSNWLEGFLYGDGAILLYDEFLWHMLNLWLENLSPSSFSLNLPHLRKVFSKFNFADRREIGLKAKKGNQNYSFNPLSELDEMKDIKLGEPILNTLFMLLGIKSNHEEQF